jgi:pimeloyl-ACP methyl ester carboxylesterase
MGEDRENIRREGGLMKHRYNIARVGDLDTHYDLADYTLPWRETPPETILLYLIETSKASPALCEWYIAQMDKTPVHVANGMDLAVAQGDLWPRLPEIQTPTLILGGAHSVIADESHRSAMRDRMPHAKVVAFEGYGHGVNLLAPERCVAEFRSFARTVK